MKNFYSVDKLLQNLAYQEAKKVLAAFEYSQKHLSDIFRRSGESYFEHGYESALVLKESIEDESLMSVILLHDLLLCKNGKNLLKKAPLTKEEKNLAEKMHKLRGLHIDAKIVDLDYALESFAKDPRLLIMRMAHRVNDVRNLIKFKPELQKLIATETLYMYTAIAGRFGFNAWRYEIEDTCFRLLHKGIANSLQRKFDKLKKNDQLCLDHAGDFLKKKLKENLVSVLLVETRIKSIYSTYRKMQTKNRNFLELTDRLALRIIVRTLDDCYRTLGIVHRFMHLIPGKLKDYIGLPKGNGYRSIHTVVYPLPGVTEQPIEIQIRTEQMHLECEYGNAAHNDYKKSQYTVDIPNTRVEVFRNLEVLKAENRSPREFEKALRTYFTEQNLLVFDENDNLFYFKKPSTALDFAVINYPEKLEFLNEIRINGRKERMQTLLKDGDVISVSFGRKVSNLTSWGKIVERQRSKEILKSIL